MQAAGQLAIVFQEVADKRKEVGNVIPARLYNVGIELA